MAKKEQLFHDFKKSNMLAVALTTLRYEKRAKKYLVTDKDGKVFSSKNKKEAFDRFCEIANIAESRPKPIVHF